MKKSAWSVLFLEVLLIYYCSGWSYEDQDSWPGICQTGKRQSPIALSRDNCTKKACEAIKLNKGFQQGQTVIAVNSEYKIQLRLLSSGSEEPTIEGENCQEDYRLAVIYVFWPAQHVVDGVRYPLSFGFVFFERKYSNLKNAALYKDGVVCLIVSFEIGEYNPSLKHLIEAVPKLKTPSRNVQLAGRLRLDKWIPSVQQYYRYEGSHMVPACEETTTFYVFDTPLTLSEKQLKKLTNITGDDCKPVVNNTRNLQEPNGREVYYYSNNQLP